MYGFIFFTLLWILWFGLECNSNLLFSFKVCRIKTLIYIIILVLLGIWGSYIIWPPYPANSDGIDFSSLHPNSNYPCACSLYPNPFCSFFCRRLNRCIHHLAVLIKALQNECQKNSQQTISIGSHRDCQGIIMNELYFIKVLLPIIKIYRSPQIRIHLIVIYAQHLAIDMAQGCIYLIYIYMCVYIYISKRCKGVCYSFSWIGPLILDRYLIIQSIK